MARRRDDLFAEVLELSLRDRARLAHELLVSLEEPPAEDLAAVERAWAKEVTRRLDELQAGKVKPIPWPKARAQIRARLRRSRAAR